MKINQLLAIGGLILTFFQTSAQPQKGSVLIGGNAAFNIDNRGDDYRAYIIKFSPFGYFFMTDKLAGGGGIGFNWNGGDANGSSVSLQPLLRYYFTNAEMFYFFGQGSGFFQNNNPGSNQQSYFSSGYGLGLGVDYFVNENVAIEAVFGFSSLKAETDENATNTLGLTLGVAAFVGKKKKF
jgi:hypothetical protein